MMQSTPARYTMRRNHHKQGPFEWQGETIEVDDGIQPLLEVFNRFEGIATNSSCLGQKGEMGFVGFVGDSPQDVWRLYESLAEPLGRLGIRVEYNEAADGETWVCVRWKRRSFDALVEALKAIKIAAKA